MLNQFGGPQPRPRLVPAFYGSRNILWRLGVTAIYSRHRSFNANKMTYQETIDFLFNTTPVFQHIGDEAYKPGLGNIETLEERLGNPHLKFRSVHIAGTNGKGSTSHMVAGVLAAAGYKTGLFTSPHLRDFRERIKIDGVMISEGEVIDFVESNRAAIEEVHPSFFEVTTSMAFDHFARNGIDVAVIETGLGGRLDSTNIIRPLVSVITNISFDHSEYLGDTLEKIAGEKAGIIKPEVPVVIGESQLESKLTFITKAKESQSPIIFADQTYKVLAQTYTDSGQMFEIENLLDGNRFSLEIDLMGRYQRMNILTALTTLDVLNGRGISISQESAHKGMATAAFSTGLSGRWQIMRRGPFVVCDTGHNEGGIRELTAQIKQHDYRKLWMIVGFVREKELAKILPLLPQEAEYIFTRPSVERGLDPESLQKESTLYGLKGTTAPTVAEAYDHAITNASPDDMIFVGGSTFVVADFLSIFAGI